MARSVAIDTGMQSGRALYMYLPEAPSPSALLPMLMQISTGKQPADIVTIHSPGFGPDAELVVDQLQQWTQWYDSQESGRVATESAKAACQDWLFKFFEDLNEESMDWGHKGASIVLKIPVSWDLKMFLTSGHEGEALKRHLSIFGGN